jgi:hypothetical protein
MVVLDVLDGLSPTLWAALFAGVFTLLLVAWKREERDDDE